MSLSVVEVKWISKTGGYNGGQRTKVTRVTPGTPESSIEFIKREYGDDVLEIISAELEPEPVYIEKTCGYCGCTRREQVR